MKKIKVMFVVIISLLLTGFYHLSLNAVKLDEYTGGELKIAVAGEYPKIREDNIKFVKFDFENDNIGIEFKKYDAVFVTEEHFVKASSDTYINMYKNSNIPFFFINSKKSYMPFITEGLSYDEVNWEEESYITGFIFNDNILRYWSYGLYNDIENENTINGTYSMVFETIETCKKGLFEN